MLVLRRLLRRQLRATADLETSAASDIRSQVRVVVVVVVERMPRRREMISGLEFVI